MLEKVAIESLIDLEEIIIENTINKDNYTEVYISIKRKEHICPRCSGIVNRVQDYYIQKVKDLDILGKPTYLILKKRRYKCKCGKVFQENNPILNKYQRISDMWKPYKEICETFLKKATFIVDKYHWTRQIIWAFEGVRKEEQKKFYKTYRKYFKRSKSLLTKRFEFLTDEEKVQVNFMLYKSDNIRMAHNLKEEFLKLLDLDDRKEARKMLSEWIMYAQSSGLKQLKKCANTMINWSIGILNSIELPYTNGFVEGCNNKIKVLKRNAYGYQNFRRFRNRILHIFSNRNQEPIVDLK